LPGFDKAHPARRNGTFFPLPFEGIAPDRTVYGIFPDGFLIKTPAV